MSRRRDVADLIYDEECLEDDDWSSSAEDVIPVLQNQHQMRLSALDADRDAVMVKLDALYADRLKILEQCGSVPERGITPLPNLSEIDFSKIPSKFEALVSLRAPNSPLRPTIIKPGSQWTHNSQSGLLGGETTRILTVVEQKIERSKCFDLLDALTRSGSLSLENVDMHIVLGSTHCFARSVFDSLVIDNVNPIEKLEQSELILAEVLNGIPSSDLISK